MQAAPPATAVGVPMALRLTVDRIIRNVLLLSMKRTCDLLAGDDDGLQLRGLAPKLE